MLDVQKHNELNTYRLPAVHEISREKAHKAGELYDRLHTLIEERKL